jgi:exonuclease SbcC
MAGFTCYSDEVNVPFRGMDIFAITGPTGAGKSTIVDALCYALYGRVPRHAETTSLISHNRDSMSVDLEFEAGGKQYRVHRGINRDAKGKRAPAPVQLEECADGRWTPIAGRVADIDREIERIVGLDYRSFTVCVLLPQGRFQDFLAGEKKDRRQVLTDLLDIGIYEEVMKLANARAAELGIQIEGHERRLAEDYGNATPEALEDVRAEMEVTRPRLELARAQREALGQAIALADTVVSARRRQGERTLAHKAVQQEIAEAEGLARDGQEQLAELRGRHKKALAALAAVSYDRARHSALERARDQLEKAQGLERDLAGASKLAADDSALTEAASALDAAAEKTGVTAEAVAEAEEALRTAERLDAAAHVRAGLKQGDPCPVCGGKVGKDLPPVEALVADAEGRLQAARAAEAAARDAAGKAEAAVAAETARQEAAVKDVQRLEKDLAAAREALKATLPEGIELNAKAIEKALNAEAARGEEARRLSEEEAAVRRDIDDLAPRVTASETGLAQLRGRAQTLEAEAAEAGREAEEAKAELIAIAGKWEWRQVSELIREKQAPSDALAALQRGTNTEIDALTRRLSELEGEERRIEEGIEKAAKIRAELEALTGRRVLFQDLGRLLRANEFQTFVLDEAMRELAAAGSVNLERLQNEARFSLRVREGEFRVVDSWQGGQERAATTLSGGETFVASLALALALADTMPQLSTGALTSLDSLFLDEGFGTLDPESLRVVIEALDALRSERRLVGIVTHVPELAALIECRIEVSKSPEGSRVTLVGV